MSGERDQRQQDADLIAQPLAVALRLYPERDARVGMRSAFADAAWLCERLAQEIEGGGRPSRRRAEQAAVARRCAVALDAARARVEVPRA